MTRVGYIAGQTLADLQEQWVMLLDAGVNVVVFDRSFLPAAFNWMDADNLTQEKREMWDYISAMEAGQDQMVIMTGWKCAFKRLPFVQVIGYHLG